MKMIKLINNIYLIDNDKIFSKIIRKQKKLIFFSF